MIKRLVFSFLLAIVIGAISYCIHSYLLSIHNLHLSYSLAGVYLFFLIAYLVIILLIEIVNHISHVQVGFSYLATFVIKILVFALTYSNQLFGEVEMTLYTRLSFIMPMALYIILEAVYAIRILTSVPGEHSTNKSE